MRSIVSMDTIMSKKPSANVISEADISIGLGLDPVNLREALSQRPAESAVTTSNVEQQESLSFGLGHFNRDSQAALSLAAVRSTGFVVQRVERP
jgi:hypothetical protein